MSYGEPIALRGQMELEQVAAAAPIEVRPNSEALFIERLQRGDAVAFETTSLTNVLAKFLACFTA